MNRNRQQSLARMIGISAAFAVSVCIGLLVSDYLKTRRLAPLEKSHVTSLEEKVKTDAQVSVELTTERERLTARSLDRDSKHKTLTTVLIILTAAFLVGMNWLKALHGQPVLPKEKLVPLRSVPSATDRVHPTAAQAHHTTAAPEINLDFVDRIVNEAGRSREAAIPILRAIQLHYGYLPDEALKKVCERTEITPAQIAGTSSFYAQFRRSPLGKHVVKICHGTACHIAGVVQINEELRRYLGISPEADTDPSHLFTLDNVACLGCCSLAPVIMIDETTVGRLTPATACEALRSVEPGQSA